MLCKQKAKINNIYNEIPLKFNRNADNEEIIYTPENPKFTQYIKVGFAGVEIAWTC